MKENFKNVYQFKIVLRDIEPKIWRRIQVPETYTFWDLHVAIQDSMGWSDSHLHNFELRDTFGNRGVLIGIPDEEMGNDDETQCGWKENISNWFNAENKRSLYTYDFGDDWRHDVVFEKILPREKGVKYPVCLAGERACPPDDCGSIPGYEELVEAMKDPSHPRHEALVEWLGDVYDPEDFDARKVIFDDPRERLKNL